MQRTSKKGFTLIELLVVIAIIGVLASIVLASLNNARRKSRDARRITDIKQIQLALELYFDGVGAGEYPNAAAATCAAAGDWGTALVSGGYMPQVPLDPGAGTPCYSYAAPASGRTTYHLAATLEDTANIALPGKDCNSVAGGAPCPTSYTYPFNQGFNGGVAGVYDVMP